jgi:hypothetical protein
MAPAWVVNQCTTMTPPDEHGGEASGKLPGLTLLTCLRFPLLFLCILPVYMPRNNARGLQA